MTRPGDGSGGSDSGAALDVEAAAGSVPEPAGPVREVRVGAWRDLQARERLVFEADGIEVGVFCLGDEVRAWLNRCPHMGGPACQGKIMPRTLETAAPDGRSTGLALSRTERHIVCPWHGYEFDMLTGAHPFDPGVRLRPFPVRVVDGEVVVTLSTREASS